MVGLRGVPLLRRHWEKKWLYSRLDETDRRSSAARERVVRALRNDQNHTRKRVHDERIINIRLAWSSGVAQSEGQVVYD